MFGKDYLENFKNNKIQTDHVFITDEAATGVAPIFVDENGLFYLNLFKKKINKTSKYNFS